MKILQLKYCGSLPAFIGCQKDSGSAVENGTQVKPVLLAVKRFAVWVVFNQNAKWIWDINSIFFEGLETLKASLSQRNKDRVE